MCIHTVFINQQLPDAADLVLSTCLAVLINERDLSKWYVGCGLA